MTQIKRFARGLAVALFCGCVAWVGGAALAKGKPGGKYGGNTNTQKNNTNNNNTPATTNPPADTGAAAQARRDADAAQVALNQSQNAETALETKLKKDFTESDSYKAALAEVKAAQAEFDAAKAPVLTAVRGGPEYQAARAAKDKAEAERNALASDPEAKPADRIRIATAVLDAGTAIGNLESVAEAGDPATMAAKAKVDAAAKKLAALQKQFRDSLKDNPEVVAAQKDVAEKTQKLADSRTAMAAALK